MNAAQYRQFLEQSKPVDWRKLDQQVVSRWEYGEKNGEPYLEPVVHDLLFVNENDIDVSIALGAIVSPDFDEPWVKKFSNPKAKLVQINFRYRGAVVETAVAVLVDGGRQLLPLPDGGHGSPSIHHSDVPLARLLFDLWCTNRGGKAFVEWLHVAGIEVSKP